MRFARVVPAVIAAALFALPATAQDAATAATGISRAFNPAVSANGLFIGAYSSRGDGDGHAHDEGAPEGADEHAHEHAHGASTESGLRVQEVELQLTSFVDSYLKADLILAVPGGEGAELEEGFVTTQGLPYGLTLKVGRFYADVGRHNRLHTHQFPFVDAPLVSEQLLGGHGLSEDGLSLSWLVPLPWYAEVSTQVLDGDNELFASPDDEDLLYLVGGRSFWDLGEAATIELGASGAAGTNAHGEGSSLAGIDLTLKWRPPRQSRDRGLVWQSEYLLARRKHDDETHERGGFYSHLQYQLSRSWWIQGRWDVVGLPRGEERRDWRVSSLLAYTASEFSSLRLQYSRAHLDGDADHQVYLQLNFTIGSHPAHRY